MAKPATTAPKGPLEAYRRRRDFARTPEPPPEVASSAAGNGYLIQKHAARRTHFDFRLELDGVLLSWAVPNGPSLDPAERRLAVRTEDHPLEYGSFEGVIPAGQYGGGTVMLWDRGHWTPTKEPRAGLKRGQLEFELHGERLRGGWVLTRLRPKPDERGDRENWLLIKRHDGEERPGEGAALADGATTSVASGRSMAEIAQDRSRVWSSQSGELAPEAAAAPDGRMPPAVAAARAAALPDFVEPQLATLVAAAPAGERWLHEIKYDGYRTQARIAGGACRMLSRSGLDWTAKFTPIADRLARLAVRDALVDGEVVVLEASGVSSFGALQQALSEGVAGNLTYFAFDLLHLDGRDLRRLPLADRKTALAALLAGEPDDGPVRYSQHYTDRGPDFFAQACRLALEGIVSKRADAAYRSGRGRGWVKSKCTRRQEFVVGGWLSSTAAGRDLRSLLVGYHEGGRLVYAGKVGTGFGAAEAERLLAALKRVPRKSPPFAAVPREAARGARWVEPEVVVETEFRAWTDDRMLRHAAFKGLREDKPAREVTLDVPIEEDPMPRPTVAAETGIVLTHPDRVLWPEHGYTKQMLADYYAEVAPLLLPHVAGRPLSLVRCPGGIPDCFFQRHAGQGLPDAVKAVRVRDEKEPYLAIDDVAGLIALVQVAALELHPWGARVDDVERPDRIVMDFDPDESLPWERVVAAGFACRDRLASMGLTGFVKTTGGKGLHVVVPIERRHGWPEVKAFAQALAVAMAADDATFVTTMAKSARRGRIFIDYLRNDRTATAVAPYSTRARPGAPVALPVDWDELRTLPSGGHYTLASIGRRLGRGDDPWAAMAGLRQRITAKAKRSVGLS